MLEFAREQWLWLFLLVGVFYVAWWFARRYRKRRVTYGRIWERVARRVLPPGWKRVLRTALTLFISGVLLSSVVLFAAGLQRPEADQPAPLLVFIVLDNSPQMRIRDGDTTREVLAGRRAQQIVDALGDNDRALLAWRKNGRLLTGRWLKRGDDVGKPPPIDWVEPEADDLSAIPPPPDLPPDPAPIRMAVQLAAPDRDAPPALADQDVDPQLAVAADRWSRAFAVPTFFETVGSPTENDGFESAQYIAPEAGDGSGGRIKFETRKPGTEVLAVDLTSGEALAVTGGQVLLPLQAEPLDVRISISQPDALPEDDVLRMLLKPRGLATVTLCYPASDGEPNPFLVEAIQSFLPGREVLTRATQPGDRVAGDLLVCDRVLPDTGKARFLMCFGVLPEGYGETAVPVNARPNLQLRIEPPNELAFKVPELTLLHGTDAVPLKEGHGLTPLAKLLTGETLVGVRRGQPELLYVGFLPHKSTLLQDRAGLLLLLRWLEAIQGGEKIVFPPFVPADSETEIQLDQPGELRIELAADNPWLPSFGPKAYIVATAADGRGKIGPFEIPGEYVVLRGETELARFTALKKLPAHTGAAGDDQLDLEALFGRQQRPDWRDYLPGVLLWIALGALVLEWLLWLTGITE